DEMLSLLQRRKIFQAIMQSTSIIQTCQRVHHTQIVKRFTLLKEPIQQLLCKAVVTFLNNVMDGNPNHRESERVNDPQPVFMLAKPHANDKSRQRMERKCFDITREGQRANK